MIAVDTWIINMKNKKTNSLFYYFKFPSFKALATTHGNGFWSNRQKTIKHNRAYIHFSNEESLIKEFELGKLKSLNFAELRIYFTKKDWDINQHGIIYTDKNWIKDIRAYLIRLGYSNKAVKEVDYSESGMQGANYVSLDVGQAFLKETKLIYI